MIKQRLHPNLQIKHSKQSSGNTTKQSRGNTHQSNCLDFVGFQRRQRHVILKTEKKRRHFHHFHHVILLKTEKKNHRHQNHRQFHIHRLTTRTRSVSSIHR